MGLAYILVGILSAAVAVFALQNNQMMSLRFITWSLDGVPLAGAILAALAVGLILASFPLSIELWRQRSRVRTGAEPRTLLRAPRPTGGRGGISCLSP